MLPRTLELTVGAWPGLEITSSGDDRIVLRRDGASVIARVLGNWAMQRIELALEQVDDRARVGVAGGRQLRARIRGELGRRGVEVVAIEPPDVGYVIGVT
jgi:head-tail adaptor